MSDFDECRWYNSDSSLCRNDSIDKLSLDSNKLVGTIPNELALLSNLSKSTVV